MGIRWRDELDTGIDLIDEQHRELFRRFDLFLSACEAGEATGSLNQLLDFLSLYVQKHFHDEEELLSGSGYPQLEAHREEHAVFMGKLKKLQIDVAGEGVALHHVIDTNALLFKWIVSHISRTDREFIDFLA